eukprot:TRINITY_DN88369_c0_g1_i1.p1 TRINITY_DN88369_c0_g1~~TRINITY_DN88369_c0_g1_i1.p1  ORF type:complete len:106 (-),score=4.97 TRINITY_DN88369_c0_g1_i1:125-442(-)
MYRSLTMSVVQEVWVLLNTIRREQGWEKAACGGMEYGRNTCQTVMKAKTKATIPIGGNTAPYADIPQPSPYTHPALRDQSRPRNSEVVPYSSPPASLRVVHEGAL